MIAKRAEQKTLTLADTVAPTASEDSWVTVTVVVWVVPCVADRRTVPSVPTIVPPVVWL